VSQVEGKTKFSRRLQAVRNRDCWVYGNHNQKQFDGLTWLTLTPYFTTVLRHWTWLPFIVRFVWMSVVCGDKFHFPRTRNSFSASRFSKFGDFPRSISLWSTILLKNTCQKSRRCSSSHCLDLHSAINHYGIPKKSVSLVVRAVGSPRFR